jgi:hypothetical protein
MGAALDFLAGCGQARAFRIAETTAPDRKPKPIAVVGDQPCQFSGSWLATDWSTS